MDVENLWKSICRPLELIFNECISNDVFRSEWKTGYVVPIHKKNGRQCLENYGPVSLLPVRGKIPERLIFNEMFPVLIKNSLISQNQSGSKPADSYVNQLLSIHMRHTNQSMMGSMLEVSF